MIRRVGSKRGDTLIEVMFAVGIFSLVAIAVVAVVNGSLRSVQASLERTMARSEIDAQAEAIRFIQEAYASEKDLKDNKVYTEAWNTIAALASKNKADDVVTFEPSNCEELYNKNNGIIYSQNAFIVNTRQLDTILTTANMGVFQEAGTYPRLIYGGDATTLSNASTSTTLTTAGGIYVVGVKGNNYYDFYIRTCWNSAGANQVSTISTVIRLYDPDME